MTTCELMGATRITDVRVQDRVKVTGTIISSQTTAIGSGLGYRCVLADGSGQLDLLFLGRAVIAGLAVGTRCRVEGVAAARGGRLAVWNPRYEVQPGPTPPVTEQITQVRVRERVPDWVVRRADQVEFVDAAPGQLRHRLLLGEIYPAGQVSQALTHFFRTDNLNALRELALQFLADEPAEEFARHLARLRARGRNDAGERMLLGVTPAPGAEDMVRRAARMAARIEAELQVVNVTSQEPGTGRQGRDDGLARLRRAAADVGATWRDLDADDLPMALVAYAKSEQVTQIVVGSSQRGRWHELVGGGSIVGRVSRLAAQAGIDVHIMALRAAGLRLG
jgi:nucleotide-binding universal stress UspA family protein